MDYNTNFCPPKNENVPQNFSQGDKLSPSDQILAQTLVYWLTTKYWAVIDCVLPNSSIAAFITSNIFQFQQQHTLLRWNSQFILISVDNNHLIDIYQFGAIVVINFIPFDKDILVSLLYRQKLAQKACIRVKQVLKKGQKSYDEKVIVTFFLRLRQFPCCGPSNKNASVSHHFDIYTPILSFCLA